MSRPIFTPEELAELAAADAEIDREDAPLTLEEWKASMRRDRGLTGPPKARSPERREADRERARAYQKAHKDLYREAHRRWYERNREYAKAWQRDYYRRNPEKHKSPDRKPRPGCLADPNRLRLLRLRQSLSLSQRELGLICGFSAATVSNWELGKAWIPAAALDKLEALTAAADSYTE